MLIKSKVRKKLKDFFDKQNKEEKDYNKTSDELGDILEQVIYESVKSIEIIIPAGTIIVVGPNGTSTNPQPITIKGTIK